MGADSTLVSAAFKLAQSQAGADVPNLKPLYEAQVESQRKMIGMVTGVLSEIKQEKEVARIGKSNQLKPFKKIVAKTYDTLYSQKETMPDKVVNAMRDEIRRLQDEFEAVNTYGKGDTQENETARTRITAQLKRITNQAINARAIFMKIGDSAGNWNEKLINENVIAPIQSILDLKNMDKNDNIKVFFNDEGDLTFTTENYNTGIREIPGTPEYAGDDNVVKMDRKQTRIGGFGREYQGDAYATDYPGGDPSLSEDEKAASDLDKDSSGLSSQYTYNATTEEYKYGDLMSFTSQQMLDALPEVNKAILAATTTLNNNAGLKGKNDIEEGRPNAYDNPDTVGAAKADFLENIITEEDYQTASTVEMLGGQLAFDDALLDRIDIPLNVIENMFFDDDGERVAVGEVFLALDRTGDGVINAEDLSGLSGEALKSFKNNHAEMIDAIVNVTNPAFNFQNSKSLLGDYYVGLNKNKYNQEYKNYNPNKGEETKFGLNPDVYYPIGQGNKTARGSSMQPRYDKFISGKDFETYDGAWKFSVDTNGNWTSTGPETDEEGQPTGKIVTKPITQLDLAKMMGFYENAKDLGLDTSKLKISIVKSAPPNLKEERKRLEELLKKQGESLKKVQRVGGYLNK